MKGNPVQALGSALIGLINEHAKLFTLESILAKQSIVPFIITLVIIVILALSTWTSLLILAGYGLYLWSQDMLIAIGGITGALLISLLLMIFMMKKYLQRLQFKVTRSHLKAYMENGDEL